MLDTQNLPSSSPSGIKSSESSTSAPPIYLDREEAMRDFDRESTQATVAKIDAQVASLLTNARVLMKFKEYHLALNLLRTASNRNSKNPTVLSALAECLEALQKFDEGLKVRRVLLDLENCVGYCHRLATLFYKLGRDEEALAHYYESLSQLITEDEALFEIYKNMGNILVRQRDFEGAEDFYNKAYTLNPKSDTLLVNFGTLEVQRNDYEKSLYCFRQAVQINRLNDKAWVGLALVHCEFGDHDLAWANLEAALDINPKNRTAVHLAANWGQRDGRIGRAITVLQEYLGDVDADEDLSLVLINLYCQSSQIAEAELECERVLLWKPENREVFELRQKLFHIQKGAA